MQSSLESFEDINEKLQIALEETLNKAGGIPLFLTGGTASALYSARSVRPLSFDLDFMILHDPSQPGLHANRIQNEFDATFQRFVQKKTFKSMKAVGNASNGCDLDFIADQQVLPDESEPDLQMTLFVDVHMSDRVQELNFEGVRVKVVPPEYVVLAKLFAGRGIDIDKYDLTDSAAVLDNFEKNNFSADAFLQDLEHFLTNTKVSHRAGVKMRIRTSLQRILADSELHKLSAEGYGLISQLADALN